MTRPRWQGRLESQGAGQSGVRVSVRIETTRCAACARGSCSLPLSTSRPVRVLARAPLGLALNTGHRVELEPIDAEPWLPLVWRAYGWPLIGLVAGALAGQGLYVWLTGNAAVALARPDIASGPGWADALVGLFALLGLAGGLFAWQQVALREHRCRGLRRPAGGEFRIVRQIPASGG